MTIEKIREDDIAACLEIYNYYIKETFFTLEEAPLTVEEYAARVHRVMSDGYPFFVARDEAERVVGFAYLDVFNPRSGYRHTADLSIYLHHDLRHSHIGGALLAAAEEAARERNIDNLISIITAENTASIRFHEKHGFVSEGLLHGIAQKFGKRFGVAYYRKSL